MNVDLATWGQFIGRLAVETALVIVLAAAVSRFVAQPSTRRAVWQGLLVAVAMLWSVELLDLRPNWPSSAFRSFTAERHARTVSQRQPNQAGLAPTSSPIADPVSPESDRGSTVSDARDSRVSGPVVWPGWLWMAGSVFVLGDMVLRRLRLTLWVRSLRCRRDLPGSTLRMVESPDLRGPVAFGIWNPTIALPAHFEERFTAPQRDAMVAHEKAHLDGRDPAWCLLADLLCAVAWWHPAVWWMRVQFRVAAESAADAVAAATLPGGHLALAEALVVLGRDLITAPGPRGLGIVGSGFRSQLARRVTQLLDARHPNAAHPTPRLRHTLAASGTLAIAGACLATPWPGNSSLGLRMALHRSDPAVVAEPPSSSASEIRRWESATVPSTLKGPRLRGATTALAGANPAADATSSGSPRPKVGAPSAPAATNRPITLEVKFAEIVERSSDDLGLDWLFGQSPTNNAPLVTGSVTNLPAQDETPRGRGLRVDLLRTEGQAARLGQDQFAALMERLQVRGGIDLVATPSVTTVSGQQARIEIKEARTLVTDVDVSRTTGTNAAPLLNYQTEKLFVGQSVDLLPQLAGDEVRLKVTASVTEFLGYDEPKTPGTIQAPGAAPLTYQEPLPRVRLRQTVADGISGAQPATARPGETIVLRGPLVTETQRNVDKVAVLGDLPLLGRLFRNESTSTVRKRLYIFVSPTLDSRP